MRTEPSSQDGGFLRALTGPAVAAAILVLFWVALMAGVREKSLTYDEGEYALAGWSAWRAGDYRLSPEAGVLVARVAGLPLALSSVHPPATNSADWRTAQFQVLGYDWFYRTGNDAAAMAAAGRAACAVLAVLLAAVVWAWSRRLFGPGGALVSLLACVLNPGVLANGALMTSDVAAALLFLAATWSWWAVLHRVSAARVLGSGLLAGALFACKMSAVLIVPVAGALALARLIDRRPLPFDLGSRRGEFQSRSRRAAAISAMVLANAAIVVAVIWAAYGFRFSAFAHPGPGERFLRPWSYALNLPHPGATGAAIDFFRGHHLLPESWLYGFATVLRRADIRRAFLNGACSETGWPWFFPYVFLVKTPLPLLGIITLALGTGWRSWKTRAPQGAPIPAPLYDTLPLWVLMVVYWAAAVSSHLNIGHRHLLPAYAPLFVLCGASARWLGDGGRAAGFARRWAGAALCALLVVLAAESALWFPNYLPYVNGVIRPREAYRHLVDSSVDWGQDLPAARRYIDEHPEGRPYVLSYFGMASPAWHGVDARLITSFGLPYRRDDPDLLLTRLPAGWTGPDLARIQREQPGYDPMGVVPIGTDTHAVFLRKAAELRLAPGTYLISATMLQPVYYSGPWGPWSSRYEATYRRLKAEVDPLLDADPSARAAAFRQYDMDELAPLLASFEEYRFARLTDFLRRRTPDDEINGSILVFRVTAADLAAALD